MTLFSFKNNVGTQLQPSQLNSPGKDIESYLASVHSIPILTKEQEQELAIKLYEEDDLDAARQLVIHHLRFVVHIARSYQGYGLPLADIIQEGNVGLMKAVDKYDPHKSWKASKTVSNDSKPSMMVFKGDVYQGLDAESLNNKQIKFAQKHLRILSGLYGILRPMDVIKPYRLEMGTKLETSKGKNLYDFWGDAIQKNVLKDLESQKSDLLINLASKEYFTVLGKMPEHINVVSPVFKDYKNGKHKIISFYAKS